MQTMDATKLHGGTLLKTPINYCYYVTPTLNETPKSDGPQGLFETKVFTAGDGSIRRRTIVRQGFVDAIRYGPIGTYQGAPYDYAYKQFKLAQPQTVVDEWATPLVKGRKEWHPFQHYKRAFADYQAIPYDYGHRFYGPDHDDIGNLYHKGQHSDPWWLFTIDGTDVGTYRPEKGLPALVLLDDPGSGFIPYPAQIAELTEAAMNSMLPYIRAELSGINSLIELRDFADLPHALNRMAQVSGRLLSGQWAHLRELYRDWGTLRNMSKEVGSNLLQWKFFLAPFISDVRAVMHSLETMHERIIAMLKSSEKVQRRHYGRKFKEYEDVDPMEFSGNVWNDPDNTHVVVRRLVLQEPSKFHAEIEYTFGYSSFQVEYAQLLGLLDAFGVNLNPATIWRAIPFSFIIDWVVSVGRWLDRLKLRNMAPTLNIHRYCWSIARERRIDCTITRSSANYPPNPSVYAPSGSTPLPPIVEKSYGRFLDVPDRASISTSKLDSQEFTLGVALTLSQMRRRNRRLARLRWSK